MRKNRFAKNAAGIIHCILRVVMISLCGLNINAAVHLTLPTQEFTMDDCEFRDNLTLVGCSDATVTREWVVPTIENEYLRIEILPDFGARVRSVVYKPTGNEETNPRNSLGRPGSVGAGNFHYDYLWAIGGFYPTLGPEHGKYFHVPWHWEVLKEVPDTVTIGLYMIDSIPWSEGHAGRFQAYSDTWIEIDFVITMVTGRTWYEADVTLRNPDNQSKRYEYWSNTSMFPGGSGSSEGYEMIAPVDEIQIDYWCGGLMAVEESVGGDSFYKFDNLRWIKNWPEMGILYAHNYPHNFWGVIDHNDPHEEGVFRISDNVHTYGLKVWGNPPSLFEPWAGTTNRFFSPVTIEAGEVKNWKEYYTPSVGLSGVTHASEEVMVNLKTDKTEYDGRNDDEVRLTAQVFFTHPGNTYHIEAGFDGEKFLKWHDTDVIPNTVSGNDFSLTIPTANLCNGVQEARINITLDENTVLDVSSPVSVSNVQDCAAIGVSDPNPLTFADEISTGKIFRLDGTRVLDLEKAGKNWKSALKSGVYLYSLEEKGSGIFAVPPRL